MSRGANTSVSYSALTAITLLNIGSGGPPRRGLVFYVFATTAGTADVYYLDPVTGAERLLQTQPVVANTLLSIDFDFHVPSARLKFTPSSQPGTVTAEGCTYG